MPQYFANIHPPNSVESVCDGRVADGNGPGHVPKHLEPPTCIVMTVYLGLSLHRARPPQHCICDSELVVVAE